MSEQFSPQWSQLLREAVAQPGLLLKAYSAFHGYSIGNQLLALIQCKMRGIQPGPISTYPGWLEKGRHVRKGERALVLCQPLTFKNREKQSESDADSFTRFVYKARWFALSQTEGDPVEPPTIPEWLKERALDALGISETVKRSILHQFRDCGRRGRLTLSECPRQP